MSTEPLNTEPLGTESPDIGTRPTIPFEEVAAPSADGATLARPVIRWAAVVWGLVMAAIAATVLVIVTDLERRQQVSTWIDSLTAGTFVLYAVVALGALLLIAGIVGLLRRASRQQR